MNTERTNQIALQLHRLGVSRKTILDIITNFPVDLVEAQLDYLPFRNARRPEAMIVDAIRYNYSAPKEFFYAKNKAQRSKPQKSLDQGAEPHIGQLDAETQRHRNSDHLGASEIDGRMEPPRGDHNPELPDLDISNWPQE